MLQFHNSKRRGLAVIVFLYCKFCSYSWFEVINNGRWVCIHGFRHCRIVIICL